MKESVNDDVFIVNNMLLLMTVKMTITWMQEINYLHQWMLPFNGIQDGTSNSGSPVGKITEFISLDNSLNIEILYSLRFNCVLSRCSESRRE